MWYGPHMIFVFLFLCGVDKTGEQLWVVRP